MGPFIGGGAGMVAVGVASFGAIADQPWEDFAAAGRRVRLAITVLQDFAFEGGVERFGQRVIGTCPDRSHGLGNPQFVTECREIP